MGILKVSPSNLQPYMGHTRAFLKFVRPIYSQIWALQVHFKILSVPYTDIYEPYRGILKVCPSHIQPYMGLIGIFLKFLLPIYSHIWALQGHFKSLSVPYTAIYGPYTGILKVCPSHIQAYMSPIGAF